MSDLLGFAPVEVAARVDDRAWLQAMLDVEAALARAKARLGLAPADVAEAIASRCDVARFDVDSIAERTLASATPVIPLVEDLRALVPGSAAEFVHAGATSQDIIDTAVCLIAKRAIDTIVHDLVSCSDRLAALADAYKRSPQIGRTLLQHAEPTTFGFVCAGWLVAIDQATTALNRVRDERLAVQLGGPVGTLASFGDQGAELVSSVATALGLATPVMSWHTDRSRIGELAGALGITSGALATVALGVGLLASSDIGEVAEGRPGGSSAMPHKRNPVRSVLVTACTHRVPGLVASILAAAPGELQRAAGGWQSEWPTVTDLLRLTGSAAVHARVMLAELRVDTERMAANLEQVGETVLAGLTADQHVAAAEAWIDRVLHARL
jgi:3-carboxy-cis,cis-muconate cycloisomerase